MAIQKRKFEAAGVGKRVGYTGRRKDLPGFLRVADVYLAEFPGAGATGVVVSSAETSTETVALFFIYRISASAAEMPCRAKSCRIRRERSDVS